jgi:hypothetical protein
MLNFTFPATERLLSTLYRHRVDRISLDKPIIVIGPDRSGTSFVYALLSNHPDVYALTTAADNFPDYPFSASFLRKLFSIGKEENYSAIPNTIGGVEGGTFKLSEAVNYLHRHLGSHNGGWRHAPSDFFTEEDLDEATRQSLPADLKKRMAVLKKTRLVMKQPGFSLKMGYLNALFPDSIFVHVVRHPLDNFHSLMAQKNKIGATYWGVRIPGWQKLSHLSSEEQTAHQLAGTYEIIRQSVAQLSLTTSSRYLPVRYESLMNDFEPEVKQLFAACNLCVPPQLLKHPEKYVRPGNGNKKRKKPSDPRACKILEELAFEMGYSGEAVRTAI